MQLDFEKIILVIAYDLYVAHCIEAEMVPMEFERFRTRKEADSYIKKRFTDNARTSLKALARELPSMNDFYKEAQEICKEMGQKGNKSIEYYLKIEIEDYIDQLKEFGNENH